MRGKERFRAFCVPMVCIGKLRLESLQLASGAIPEVMRETRTHDENSGSSAQTFGRISHFPAEPIQWVQDNRRV